MQMKIKVRMNDSIACVTREMKSALDCADIEMLIICFEFEK